MIFAVTVSLPGTCPHEHHVSILRTDHYYSMSTSLQGAESRLVIHNVLFANI